MNQSKIYVGNLSYSVTSEDLNKFFSQYGEITEAKVISDRDTGRSKGFAFVTFESQQAAQASLESNGTEFEGRKLNVNMAKENPRRTGGGGGGGGGARKRPWQGGGDRR